MLTPNSTLGAKKPTPHLFFLPQLREMTDQSVKTMATGWMIRFQFPTGAEFFTLPPHRDQLWGTLRLLSNG